MRGSVQQSAPDAFLWWHLAQLGADAEIYAEEDRANVPLAVSVGEEDLNNPDAPPPDKKELKEEVLNTAKMLGMQPNFKLLMLDTENKFVSTGVAKEIAAAAQGKYHYIPKASEKAVASVASQAISDLRN